jgi:hypothetical protein
VYAFRLPAAIFSILLFALGCTKKEPPAFAAPPSSSRSEDGGEPEDYGDAGGYTITVHDTVIIGQRDPERDGGGDAGATGESGSGGSGGEDGGGAGVDGGTADPFGLVVTGPLTSLDPEAVYLTGAKDPEDLFTEEHVIARAFQVEEPAQSRDARRGPQAPSIRRTDGHLVYITTSHFTDNGGAVMGLFASTGEVDPEVDERIDTPACSEYEGGPGMFHLHPETGAVFYTCERIQCYDITVSQDPLCAVGPWWNEAGETVTDGALLAVGFDDLLLVAPPGRPVAGLELLSGTSGEKTQVVLPDNEISTNGLVFAARAVKPGFWVVVGSHSRMGPLYRWHILPDGVVEEQGEYSNPAVDDYYTVPGQPTINWVDLDDTVMRSIALSGEGELYQTAWTAGDKKSDLVYRQQLLPLGHEVVFTEAHTTWFTGVQDGTWVYATQGDWLFTAR